MKFLLIGLVLLLLAGCSSVNTADVKYYNLSPTTVGATVFCESHNATAINYITIDRWVIDKQGHCVQVNHDSASSQGALPSLITGLAGSSGATAVTGAVIGAMTK